MRGTSRPSSDQSGGRMKQSASSHKRREDILISVCFADLPKDTDRFDSVRKLASEISARFAFWEFVLTCDAEDAEDFLPLVHEVSNLRLFKVRSGTQHYRKRVIVASEAIGDIVALVSADELPYIDLVNMLEETCKSDQIMMTQRSNFFPIEHILNAPLVALGHGAGFKVDLRTMQTATFPRTILNHLLAHPDKELALRFPPRDNNTPIFFVTANKEITKPLISSDFSRRLTLIHTILINLAPRLLFYVSILSALTSITAFLYFFYIMGAWLLLPTLEPGWFTISLMLSVSAFFMGGATFGLSIGLQHLLRRVERERIDDIVDEVNKIDLFGKVTQELNVEVEISRPGHDKA